MTLRWRLLVFGYPLLELVTLYLVAQWIGWGWALLLILAGFPVGFAVMRSAGESAARALQRADGGAPDAGHAFTFLAGLLIAIPGFWTDLAGILLLVPPVRRLLQRRSRGWIETRFTTLRVPGTRYPGYGAGDVIQGTVIHDTVIHDTVTYEDQTQPPAPGDGTPRGLERGD